MMTKSAQRYRCHSRDTILNDFTETMCSEYKLSLPEILCIIRGIEEGKIVEVTQKVDRTYKMVLNFVHEVQDALNEDSEFNFTGISEADEVYVVAVRIVLIKMSRVSWAQKDGHKTVESDKPPVMTLACRSDGQAWFLVYEDLEDTDEDIVEYGDEDDSATLCTDQYSIHDGTNEYDVIDDYLGINHTEHYVVGDIHTNSCENRHSFFRNWLRRFRGVSNTTYVAI